MCVPRVRFIVIMTAGTDNYNDEDHDSVQLVWIN